MLPSKLDRFADQPWLRRDARAVALGDSGVRPAVTLLQNRTAVFLATHGTRKQPAPNKLLQHAVSLKIPLGPTELLSDSPSASPMTKARSTLPSGGDGSFAFRAADRSAALKSAGLPDYPADSLRFAELQKRAEVEFAVAARARPPRTRSAGATGAMRAAQANTHAHGGHNDVGHAEGQWHSGPVDDIAVLGEPRAPEDSAGMRASDSRYTHMQASFGSSTGGGDASATAGMSFTAKGALARLTLTARSTAGIAPAPMSAYDGNRTAWAHEFVAPVAASAGAGAGSSPQPKVPLPTAVRLVSGEVVPLPAHLIAAAAAPPLLPSAPAGSAAALAPLSQTALGGTLNSRLGAVPLTASAYGLPSRAALAEAAAAGATSAALSAGTDSPPRRLYNSVAPAEAELSALDTRECPLPPLERRILAEATAHAAAAAAEAKAMRLAVVRAERARLAQHPRGFLTGDGGLGPGVSNGGGAGEGVQSMASRHGDYAAAAAARAEHVARMVAHDEARRAAMASRDHGPTRRGYDILSGQPAAGIAPPPHAEAFIASNTGLGMSLGLGMSMGDTSGGVARVRGMPGDATERRAASAGATLRRSGVPPPSREEAAARGAAQDAAAAAAREAAGAAGAYRRPMPAEDGTALVDGLYRRSLPVDVTHHPLWHDSKTVLTGRGEHRRNLPLSPSLLVSLM